MIHNEKQLRKIIKEVANYSLLKEINFADNNSFGMFGGNSFGGRNNKNKTRNKNAIKIDDEIIAGNRGENLKGDGGKIIKKNQLIIESIFQIMECNSSDFTEFFKKSFSKSKIDDDFIEAEDYKKSDDERKIEKFLGEWQKTLNKQTNDLIGQYNAAYVILKDNLENYIPKWTVLWCLFKDIRKILETDNLANDIINNSSAWLEQSVGDSNNKIFSLKDNIKEPLRQKLINIINEKLQITSEDVNELGTDLFNGSGMGNILQTVLQFFFGDDVKDIMEDIENLLNSDIVKSLTSAEQSEVKKEIQDSPVIQKVVKGQSDQLTKQEVQVFEQQIQTVFKNKK